VDLSETEVAEVLEEDLEDLVEVGSLGMTVVVSLKILVSETTEEGNSETV
jgi:hypothetical protein